MVCQFDYYHNQDKMLLGNNQDAFQNGQAYTKIIPPQKSFLHKCVNGGDVLLVELIKLQSFIDDTFRQIHEI